MNTDFQGAELCLSIDPAQTADYMATSLLKLRGMDATGKAQTRWLGGARSQGVSYDKQVRQIVRCVERLYDRGASGVQVIIDSGGVGKSVCDHVRSESPLTSGAIGISMHGGERSWTQHSDRTVRASKVSVVGALQASLETARVTWDSSAPGADVLMKEIQDLRAKQTQSGAIKIEARTGRHDDMLFSLAQANFLLIEGCDGEEPLWNQTSVSFWDQLHNSRPPSADDVEDYMMPTDILQPRSERDQPKPARYRFSYRG